LRAPAGHLIVLPNSSAASQVIINLNSTYRPWPIAITIRLNRNTDQEAARKLAVGVAKEHAGESSVVGCFLTKVDGTSITLELRMLAPDAAGRDALRSKLIAELAQRFGELRPDPGNADMPAFS
jgi:small-conductance mechanosensitive channel